MFREFPPILRCVPLSGYEVTWPPPLVSVMRVRRSCSCVSVDFFPPSPLFGLELSLLPTHGLMLPRQQCPFLFPLLPGRPLFRLALFFYTVQSFFVFFISLAFYTSWVIYPFFLIPPLTLRLFFFIHLSGPKCHFVFPSLKILQSNPSA